jgi:hypothetical protein
MQSSFWDDLDAWPPRKAKCPHCGLLMVPAPRPTRLHDRCAEVRCPGCGGLHARVAGDPRALHCPGHPDADCYTALTHGTGPLWPPFSKDFDYFAPDTNEESSCPQ